MVGTVSTARGLSLLKSKKSLADIVEVRVDSLLAAQVDSEKILDALRARTVPALLTLRLPEEGGNYPWAVGERAALFTALMPDADAIDVEMVAAYELANVMILARKLKLCLVLSAHSISAAVPAATLQKWAGNLQRAQPDVAKISVRLNSSSDIKTLARIILDHSEQNWALMGLGSAAALSRIVLAGLGSALVYGYLDQPAAPGQPSVVELRKALGPFLK